MSCTTLWGWVVFGFRDDKSSNSTTHTDRHRANKKKKGKKKMSRFTLFELI